jgi:O-antigen/teichoic acid export membrane protein
VSLTSKSKAGVLWNSLELLAQRGLAVITTLVLAYFLSPEDFGLLAMIAVFLAVGTSLMESGFRQALIRKLEISELDLDTAFYSNVTLGVVSYITLYFFAPVIADFYDEPRIELLIQVSSVAIIIQSLQIVQIAILSRKLEFKKQLQASFPSNFISGLIAVILAVGFEVGVWALVWQIIIAATIQTCLIYRLEPWRPRLQFSKKSLKSLYQFGYKLFLAGLLDTVFKNVYVAVIAKLFATGVAGHYFLANKIKQVVVTQIVRAIQNVTFPALASIQDEPERLKGAYQRVVRLSTFLLFPVMGYIIVCAEILFNVLLPDAWLPTVPYLKIMCVAGFMYPLHSINLNILKVTGRSDLFLYIEVFKYSLVSTAF